MELGDLWIAGAIVDNQLEKARFSYRNIRNTAIEDNRPAMLTIRCETDLRVLTPVEGTNGAFSTFIQFNAARYTIRAMQYGTPQEEIYFLTEIAPPNGQWNIESGTE